MTVLHVPSWWPFALLALAAFRVYRLIARDTITAPLREIATYADDRAVELGERPSRTGLAVVGDDEQPKSLRVYASTLIRCPWCAGFYVSLGWWFAWTVWPQPTLFAAAPFALSGVVALAAKLDG